MNTYIFWIVICALSITCLAVILDWVINWNDQKYYEEMQRKYSNGELNANS